MSKLSNQTSSLDSSLCSPANQSDVPSDTGSGLFLDPLDTLAVSSQKARRYTSSSSFKVVLALTSLIGIVSIVLAYFVNQFNTGALIDRIEIAIGADYESFVDWHEMAPFLSIPEIIDRVKQTRQQSLNSYQGLYSYQSPSGDYIYGSLSPDDVEVTEFFANIILLHVESSDVQSEYDFEGTHRFAAKIYDLENGARLLIGRDIENALNMRTRLQQLGLISILLMLTVIIGCFFLSTYVVRMTNRIGETVEEIISTGDFSRRINVDKAGNDLTNVAYVLNQLLEKTDILMHSVRQVSDNIAHDLRTPLTRLRNRLDELDSHLKNRDDLKGEEIVESLTKEADHILGTFGALLRIARIESGKREKEFEEVRLTPLLEDILELYEPIAENKQISIKKSIEDHSIWGDPDMLFQVFLNLIDNALKFTPEGGSIEVGSLGQGDLVCIGVSDTGEGILPEDKEKVFDRFYRGEKSRHTKGNGLGLSLVQAVMKLHNAFIEIKDNEPGTKFIIHIARYKKN